MAGAFEGVKVTGLRELQRACADSEKEVKTAVRSKLSKAAEPVRVEAERVAASEIRNLGPAWGRMRVGVTTTLVYVAPKSRRHGGTARKNLGNLLLKSMQEALDTKTDDVVKNLEGALDEIAARNW